MAVAIFARYHSQATSASTTAIHQNQDGSAHQDEPVTKQAGVKFRSVMVSVMPPTVSPAVADTVSADRVSWPSQR